MLNIFTFCLKKRSTFISGRWKREEGREKGREKGELKREGRLVFISTKLDDIIISCCAYNYQL